jgi:hypothetical protein
MTTSTFHRDLVISPATALRRRWLSGACLLSLGLALLPGPARAEDPAPQPTAAAPEQAPPPPPPPEELPTPPPEVSAPPESAAPSSEPEQQPAAAPAVDGQWVYTNQYGWVWMPYSQAYTYVPNEGYPAMYLYGPTLGWRWVAAPWVLGWGPAPYWGASGRAHFGWYAHPWFAHRVYRAAPAARGRAASGWHGAGGAHFHRRR